MKKFTVKIPAKVNFTLDVLGVEGKFHNIESLVASINIYDAITVCKRRDGRINLEMRGIPVNCEIFDNNAYKAAKLFKERFSTKGVDVIVEKNIPVGSGLGGSSADIAGVLVAMDKVFEKKADLKSLASELGSDVSYMLEGGYAVIKGKGDIVERKDIERKFYLLMVTEEKSVSAGACYKKFDVIGEQTKPCTERALKELRAGKLKEFFKTIKNDLTKAAITYVEQIDFNQKLLKRVNASGVVMTGSGSAVLGIYETKEERDSAYKILRPIYKDSLIKAETL